MGSSAVLEAIIKRAEYGGSYRVDVGTSRDHAIHITKGQPGITQLLLSVANTLLWDLQ